MKTGQMFTGCRRGLTNSFLILVALSGCAPATINTEGWTPEQKMMLMDRMRLTIPPIQYYPMQIQQSPARQTYCHPDGFGGYNCMSY